VNPRQRRGMLLLIIAAIGGLAVFGLVASYVSSVRTEVGPRVPVLRLRGDVEAFRPVTARMVDQVEVPRRWLPDTAVQAVEDLQGMVAGADLRRGSYLQADMLVPPPALEPGQREIAILVDAETGVAGKVERGSYVDIFATFQSTAGSRTRSSSKVIVRSARVLDVGSLERVSTPSLGGLITPNQVVPVTFALSIKDSLVLTYAESFATKVRLALIGSGDTVDIKGSLVYEGGAARPAPSQPKPPSTTRPPVSGTAATVPTTTAPGGP
jgi:pilus assembly protein CpaB